MNIEDVIALSKAGFTSDQIMQMAQAPQQATAPQQPMVQQPTQDPQAKDPFQQLFEQMTGIKQAIQTNNIQNSQITGAAPQTTDDILASIIQPTKPKED